MIIHGFFHAVRLRCGWSQGSCFQQAAANRCSQIYSNAQANMNALLQICSPANLDFDHVSILIIFNMPATLENGRFMAKISSAGIFSNIRRHFSGAYNKFTSKSSHGKCVLSNYITIRVHTCIQILALCIIKE